MKSVRRKCCSILFVALAAATFATKNGARNISQDFAPSALPIKSLGKLKSGPAGWERFQIGEPPLFTIAFPQAPQGLSRITSRKDAPEQTVFVAANQTTVFTVSLSVTDSEPAKSEHQKWKDFNNSAAGFVDGLKKNQLVDAGETPTLARDKRIRLNSGIEGFQREVSYRQRSCRVQVFSIGPHLLMVSTIWNTPSPERERELFFNSLTLEMARGSAEETAVNSPLAQWQRYELGDGEISVMLPAAPQETRRAFATRESKDNEVVYYRTETEEGFYLLGFMNGSAKDFNALTPSERNETYAHAWEFIEKDISQSMKRELRLMQRESDPRFQFPPAKAQKTMVGGLPGEEKNLQNDAMQLRVQITFSHGRMFMAAGFWTIGTPLATREAFLKSIKFSSRP